MKQPIIIYVLGGWQHRPDVGAEHLVRFFPFKDQISNWVLNLLEGGLSNIGYLAIVIPGGFNILRR
mgnify:CR=1 FL=1